MTQCKECNKEIVRTSPRANNVKYCGVVCRNKYTYRRNKGTHNDSNAIAHAKTAEYAEGKIQCKLCNGWFMKLGAHTYQYHDVTTAEYKEMQGLDRCANMIHKDLKTKLQDNVMKNKSICIDDNLLVICKKT